MFVKFGCLYIVRSELIDKLVDKPGGLSAIDSLVVFEFYWGTYYSDGLQEIHYFFQEFFWLRKIHLFQHFLLLLLLHQLLLLWVLIVKTCIMLHGPSARLGEVSALQWRHHAKFLLALGLSWLVVHQQVALGRDGGRHRPYEGQAVLERAWRPVGKLLLLGDGRVPQERQSYT